MLPAFSLGWKHASLHAWIQRVIGAPGRETSIERWHRIIPWGGLCGTGLLLASWFLTLCVYDSLRLWTKLHPRQGIRELSSASKASVRITSLPFSPPTSFSLPILKGYPVSQLGLPPWIFRTTILSLSFIQAAIYNNLSFTSVMSHPI